MITKETYVKTTLHTYSFDLDRVEDREPYHQLKHKLLNTPGRGHRMHAIKTNHDFNPEAGEIELEPEHLFENQWNANVGRVFDWYEEAIFSPYNGKENKLIKRGHYLDITPEMVEIRQNTLKCGYTGDQFFWDHKQDGERPKFNTRQSALGSCYLKESELHLLRLLPVCEEFTGKRAELTPEERDYLLPLYIAAQTKTTGEAREKQLAEINAEFEKDHALAVMERDGKLWLLSNGVPLENVIFYTHTGRFNFGWRSPFTGAARDALLAALAKFPFPYDVK